MTNKIAKSIVDKNGKATTVYVNPEEATEFQQRVNAVQLTSLRPNVNQAETYTTPGGRMWMLAPEGAISGSACDECGEFIVAPNHSGSFHCEFCGIEIFSVEMLEIYIEPESQRYLDPDNVKKDRWYHVTARNDWHDDVLSTGDGNRQDQVLVHLGTFEAAMARGEHIANSMDGQSNLVCYEVEFNPKTRVSEEIASDDNDYAPTTIGEARLDKDYDGNGITRYVNEYERPGSISLVANPEMFTVTNRFSVQL